MSPWCCWRRDEHHRFCARSAASPLREAPWLGCSVADTSIEMSLDALPMGVGRRHKVSCCMRKPEGCPHWRVLAYSVGTERYTKLGENVSVIEQARSKVQRILTDNFGRVEIDRDNDFIIRKGSAVTFVRLREGFGDDGVVVDLRCPMLTDVPLTADLFRWVATEGQWFKMGGMYVNPDENEKTGWLYFKYSLTGDDLDESELLNAVGVVMVMADKFDNELLEKFGGELFGE